MRLFAISTLDRIPLPLREFATRRVLDIIGIALLTSVIATALALATWSTQDPSLNFATGGPVRNLLGMPGAIVADSLIQLFGLGSILLLLPAGIWGWRLISRHSLDRIALRLACWVLGVASACAFLTVLPTTDRWPLPTGLGGVIGDALLGLAKVIFGQSRLVSVAFACASGLAALLALSAAGRLSYGDPELTFDDDEKPKEKPRKAQDQDAQDSDSGGEPGWAIVAIGAVLHGILSLKAIVFRRRKEANADDYDYRDAPRWDQTVARPDVSVPQAIQRTSTVPNVVLDPVNAPKPVVAAHPQVAREPAFAPEPRDPAVSNRVSLPAANIKTGKRAQREAQPSLLDGAAYQLPALMFLTESKRVSATKMSVDALEQNARLLEGVLDDFGVKGEIINVRPGPVVTLYELEPAPGIKSSRVIGLADDIARSMSAISARVAVVQGRNAIGIELPNQSRETVFLRELLSSEDFEKSKHRLAIAMGKTIGGEPVIVDLARMPHLLVAGTTGSGKSVAINTMILSLLYRLKPDECKLIMIDPKMLELSVYDGIPHLLTPVVTDPKKAVVALKWAVREMEDRYKKMSKIGVRNIDGFNVRVAEAKAKGEIIRRTVQTGYDKETGEAVFENEEFDLSVLPYIVVIVDEMADLMMVAGKDIEGAIQRLAQMARAAGIHLIMATQRPSVDVITGTIKANFPTRVSFQVTSKIDSRTILGEQGAEQLLGQGDMLYMAGGGRISRVHGPFVSDTEVEKIVAHLKTQGQPQYLEAITMDDEELAEDAPPLPGSMDAEEGLDLYDRAVAIVLRDRKCSTSYIQRRLSVGYNKAASLVERMEKEGLVSPPNHSGKREILVGGGIDRGAFDPGPDDDR
jgi:S-DNA-T family DNA segregation ATPase FtsK/SpoIIIE